MSFFRFKQSTKQKLFFENNNHFDTSNSTQSFPARGNRRSKSLPKNLAKKYNQLKGRKESSSRLEVTLDDINNRTDFPGGR